MKSKTSSGKIRLFIQLAFTALSNGYLKGFTKGQIFTGASKYLCVPGMNCYSCPGALGSCPIGALQATLNARQFKMSLYVLGLLTVFGTVLGRFVCGFLCPFGLIQDLLFKIPFIKKIRRLPGEKCLRWLRFVFLGIFVILLPLFVIDFTGLGEPWFCKWICPVGTLEGGIPLVLLNNAMRGAAGFLFRWKLVILAITLLGSVIIYRPFCRYVCPLGAVYGLFNKISLYRIKIDSEKCIGCSACQKACHLDIPVWKTPDSMDCIRCGTCKTACPHNAIS
ncbi:4Fe-4S binding domain-containing protein [Treponema bryantii]|uniref:4Fe-4S binding domain-containing protein n=1 Tax=Treponema bryantii TaxID=163 RepID=A0A1I3KPU4_9SPIR|nr:4Fe-4S binding protein [Treponema bryantii]SFI74457.1 4Fe-4S binding domain-containing protein [Treponema bryantii]